MTILSSPTDLSSVNSPLVWVVEDSDYASSNYQYVADVYVNAVMVFRALSFPNPTNTYGIFDLSDVIRQYVNAAFKDEQLEGEWKISVEVKFGEQFGGTLYTNQVTSTKKFCNTYLIRGEVPSAITAYNDKPASNRPIDVYMAEGTTTFYVPYYATTTTPFLFYLTSLLNLTPTAANTMMRINIANPLATADYNVTINNDFYSVHLVCPGLYTNYLIHFLNKWGGWESMLFNKASRKIMNIERKSYQQLPYRVASGVVSYLTGSVYHQQATTFGAQFDEKIKISTDLLTDAEYRWLYQLVFSPILYLEENGILYPVQVTNSDYAFNETIIDNLTNLTIDISFANKLNTQFT